MNIHVYIFIYFLNDKRTCLIISIDALCSVVDYVKFISSVVLPRKTNINENEKPMYIYYINIFTCYFNILFPLSAFQDDIVFVGCLK